ncbi:MAG: cupin domain-containing protein [Candidatus Latescibacterota bacterium]|jgi:quercetin dioxygenase-like cupin family protein
MAFFKLDEIPKREMLPGCTARFIHSENMTFSHWYLDKEAVIPLHSHPHEQVTTLIEGELELTIGSETRCLRPGSVAIIPSGSPHSVLTKTECYVLDVFYPVREDYR